MRKVKLAIGGYYHIYNRGVDKRSIFLMEADYSRFMMLLYLANNTSPVQLFDKKKWKHLNPYEFEKTGTIVDIGAYCLMTNHFHILIKEKTENGISTFMQKLQTAYTMYFNIKYGRSGSLFEGKFKSQHADNDNYLKYLYSYIHLNPIKIIDPGWKEHGITNLVKSKDFLESYQYSSYSEYNHQYRPEKVILNNSEFPEYFLKLQDFHSTLNDFLEYRHEV